jgi:hypothetical protein
MGGAALGSPGMADAQRARPAPQPMPLRDENPPEVSRVLASLGPNEGRNLGPIRIAGDFNDTALRFNLHRTGPRSRDYTLKTVWSSARRTSLFTGANHGSPHRLNDVWEFDLSLPGWRLLYAPDLPRDYAGLGEDASDVVFNGGVLQTVRGGPAVIAHGWWGQTWDDQRHCMLFMNTWVADVAAAIRRVGGDPEQRFKGPPVWAFDPQARRWSFVYTHAPWPAAPFGAMMEHVPALGGTLWHSNGWQMRGTWLLGSSDNAWQLLAGPGNASPDPAFSQNAPVREAVGWHDPSRGQLIAHAGRDSFRFNLAQRQWSRLQTGAAEAPVASDASTPVFFDPLSRHGLMFERPARRLWAWDPDAPGWRRLSPAGDPMPSGPRMLAVMDPFKNVLVIADDATAWVYRYRVS